MSMWDPLSSPCLNNSAFDTWHAMSHSKCVKCPVLPSCLEKHEILTVLEFDMVARFRETIQTMKSISSFKV